MCVYMTAAADTKNTIKMGVIASFATQDNNNHEHIFKIFLQ